MTCYTTNDHYYKISSIPQGTVGPNSRCIVWASVFCTVRNEDCLRLAYDHSLWDNDDSLIHGHVAADALYPNSSQFAGDARQFLR